MEPISLIVTALAAGATAAAKPVATKALTDAYSALKQVIMDRYDAAKDSVEHLEKAPDKEPRREGVAEDLTSLGATTDTELVERAQDLMDVIKADDPDVARTFGLRLKDFSGENLNVRDFDTSASEGPATGVEVEGAHLEGSATFEGIITRGGPHHPKRGGQ